MIDNGSRNENQIDLWYLGKGIENIMIYKFNYSI